MFLFTLVQYTVKVPFLAVNLFENKLIAPCGCHILYVVILNSLTNIQNINKKYYLRFLYITKKCELWISPITRRRLSNFGGLTEMPN